MDANAATSLVSHDPAVIFILWASPPLYLHLESTSLIAGEGALPRLQCGPLSTMTGPEVGREPEAG